MIDHSAQRITYVGGMHEVSGQSDVMSTRINSGKPTTLIARFMGANMGPIWGRQDPGVPHIGPHEPCYLGTDSESWNPYSGKAK